MNVDGNNPAINSGPSSAPSVPSAANANSSNSSSSMSSHHASRWYFSRQQLMNTVSIRQGLAQDKELSYRQQAANFIQDMGQRLQVTQLCINTAIVYMQRFYMFHSFCRFHRNSIASAALFLAAKVEEQPRKLEHVIKVAHICLHRDQPQLDTRSEAYSEQAQELVTNENILLQTLGFDVAIDHPHTHVVRCCQLVKASKELAQTSYFMATNSLHLTTMCLRYPPTVVACVCIHLACKWSNYKIPLSAQNRPWFSYVDSNATLPLLDKLTDEFLFIFDKCPSRLKKKIMASSQATREEEERRSKEAVLASSYQPDFSRSKHDDLPGPKVVQPLLTGKSSAPMTDGGHRQSDVKMSASSDSNSSSLSREVNQSSKMGIPVTLQSRTADSNPPIAVAPVQKSIFDLDADDDGVVAKVQPVSRPRLSDVSAKQVTAQMPIVAGPIQDDDEDDIDRLIEQEAANVPIDDFEQSSSEIGLSLCLPPTTSLAKPAKLGPEVPTACRQPPAIDSKTGIQKTDMLAETASGPALSSKINQLFSTDSDDESNASTGTKRDRLDGATTNEVSSFAKRPKVESVESDDSTAQIVPSDHPAGREKVQSVLENCAKVPVDVSRSKKHKHKDKKSKKSKHRDVAKDEDLGHRQIDHVEEGHHRSGSSSSVHKKKKKKHKHRSRESKTEHGLAQDADDDASTAVETAASQSRLKIKLKHPSSSQDVVPDTKPARQQPAEPSSAASAVVAPLKISLSSKEGDLQQHPAQPARDPSLIMSRAMGSSHDVESRYLNHHLIGPDDKSSGGRRSAPSVPRSGIDGCR